MKMDSYQLFKVVLVTFVIHRSGGQVFPESHITLPSVISKSGHQILVQRSIASHQNLVLQLPIGAGYSAKVLHYKLAVSKRMSSPVYTLTHRHNRSRVLISNHSSECHYSATLWNTADSTGSISLCSNGGKTVEGVLPINSTHIGYIYPVSNSTRGLRHRLNIYPHSMAREDWAKLDAAYAKLSDPGSEDNSPAQSMEVMLKFLPNKLRNLLRKKRAADYTLKLDSPPKQHVVTQDGPFLMELYLIADRDFYAIHNSNMESVIAAAQNIINFVNNRFRTFDLHIAVTGLEIWKDSPQDYNLSAFNDPRKTVDALMAYVSSFPLEWRFDCVHLLHGRSTYYNGKSAGMAKEATMCSRPFCVGFSIITRDSRNSATAGIIMSHELAHNLGSGHDEETPNCRCPASACIMSANLFGSPLHQLPWSDCSSAAVRAFLDSGVRHCLLDPAPTGLDGQLRLNSPVVGGGGWPSRCGNGLVEPGEACDCGGEHGCAGNPCCVAATCQLAANATCGTGGCCDLSTCRPHPSGHTCRPSRGECDLSEHCDGRRDACPADVWRLDGTACDSGNNFCWSGRCPSADAACQTVWGPGSRSQGADCYALNVDYPDSIGIFGCRFNRINSKSTVREMCLQSGPGSGRIGSSGHARCGRLMCQAPSASGPGVSLAAGVYSGGGDGFSGGLGDSVGGHLGHAPGQARLPGYHTPLSHAANGRSVCRAVMYDYGPLVRDPGLVPDGVGCGTAADPNRLCDSGSCIPATDVLANSLQQAFDNRRLGKADIAASSAACASAGGLVNSRGNCHCPRGFAPPDCRQPGAGGSVDSGPLVGGYNGVDGGELDGGSSGQGAGTVAGVVFAVLLVLVLAIVSLVLLMRYRKSGHSARSRWCDLLRLTDWRRGSPAAGAAGFAKSNAPATTGGSANGVGGMGVGGVRDQSDRRLINGSIASQHQQLLHQHQRALRQTQTQTQPQPQAQSRQYPPQPPQPPQPASPAASSLTDQQRQRPVISGAHLISSTYTDGDLTDRSAVSPQIRGPKLASLRPPPAPPKPYSLPYGRQRQQRQQQQQQQPSVQLQSTVV